MNVEIAGNMHTIPNYLFCKTVSFIFRMETIKPVQFIF